MVRFQKAAALTLALGLGVGSAAAQESSSRTPPWHGALAPYLARLPKANPEAASLLAESQSLKRFGEAASALPDPMIGIGMQAVPTDLSLDREPMTQAPVIALQQVIPFPKKLFARESLLSAQGDVAKARGRAVSEAQGLAVAEGTFRIVQLGRELDYVRETLRWLDLLYTSAEARYRTGRAAGQDVDQIQVEIGRLRADLSNLEAMLADAKANWRRALGIEAPLIELQIEQPWVPPAEVTTSALSRNPGVIVAAQMREAARRRVDVERAQYYPNINLEAGYGVRQNDRRDFLTARIGVSVPLWAPWSQNEAVEGAKLGVEAARLHVDDVRQEVRAMLERVEARLASASQRQRLYANTIIPAAETARLSAQSAYNAGGADVFVPIEAIRRELVTRREYARVIAERRAAEARILALAGLLVEPAAYEAGLPQDGNQ